MTPVSKQQPHILSYFQRVSVPGEPAHRPFPLPILGEPAQHLLFSPTFRVPIPQSSHLLQLGSPRLNPRSFGEPFQHLSVPSNFESAHRPSPPLPFGQPAQYLPGEPAPRPSPLSFGQPDQCLPGEPAPRSSPPLPFGQPAQYLPGEPAPRPSPPLSCGQPDQCLPGEPAPRSSPLPFGQPAQYLPGGPAPRPSPLSFGQPDHRLPGEPAPRRSPLSFGQPDHRLPGEPTPRSSPPLSFGQPDHHLPGENASRSSPLPTLGEPAQHVSVPPTFGENQQPEMFSGDASCSTMTKSISEVRHASSSPPAHRRMTFHHVRLSAALKAFRKDKRQTSRHTWWMQNLGFELVRTQLLTDQCIFTMHTGRITR